MPLLFRIAISVLASVILSCDKIAAESSEPKTAPIIRDSDSPTISGKIPIRLDLSRRNLPNFLTDEAALTPYRMGEDKIADLRDVFTLGSIDAPYAVFWDPLACRLVGILDLEASTSASQSAPSSPTQNEGTGDTAQEEAPAPNPYIYLATGMMPLSKSAGASGPARYFGFRLVDGLPEFLYSCGSLRIEERLWLEEGGRVLQQRFSAVEASAPLQITVPDSWKDRIVASKGTWKGSTLTVPKESANEVVLSYRLAPPASDTETVTTAIP